VLAFTCSYITIIYYYLFTFSWTHLDDQPVLVRTLSSWLSLYRRWPVRFIGSW